LVVVRRLRGGGAGDPVFLPVMELVSASQIPGQARDDEKIFRK